MLEPLFDGPAAPFEIGGLDRPAAIALEPRRRFEQALRSVLAAVENNVLAELTQLGIDLFIDGKLPALTIPISMPTLMA